MVANHNARLSKRQRHHQLNIEKQRVVRRLSKQRSSVDNPHSTTTSISDITPVMIEEASLRCSIDRFRGLLPPKVKSTHIYPPHFARISVRALPYAAKKFSLPWLSAESPVIDLTTNSSEGYGQGSTLTDELIRFTAFVTVIKLFLIDLLAYY
jgi:hypothetical protein